MGVKNNLKLIFSYFGLNIKKEWQYKASFIMQIITMILNDLFFIIQWKIIFSLVDNIGGYGFKETMLLWSISAGAFGVAHTFFAGAWKIKDYVYDGRMDVYFTQPKNLLINVSCSDTEVATIGDMLYSFVVLAIIGAEWWWYLLILPVMFISGLIYVSMYITYINLCFYIKGGDALAHTVENTITKVAHYPPIIFSNFVKLVLSTFIPAMFIHFIPAEHIFIKFNLLYFFIYLLSCVVWIAIAFITFNSGVKRYNSGSVMGGRE